MTSRCQFGLTASAGMLGTLSAVRAAEWACVHAKIGLQAVIPGIVAQRAPGDPLLVAHRFAPLEKRHRVGSHRMPQLPGAALHDLEHLLSHHRWRYRVLQGAENIEAKRRSRGQADGVCADST